MCPIEAYTWTRSIALCLQKEQWESRAKRLYDGYMLLIGIRSTHLASYDDARNAISASKDLCIQLTSTLAVFIVILLQ